MTLRDKIAAFLWETENPHEWGDFTGLSTDEQADWRERADSIVDIMSSHFHIV